MLNIVAELDMIISVRQLFFSFSNIALAFGFGFGFDKIFETLAKSPTLGEESTKP